MTDIKRYNRTILPLIGFVSFSVIILGILMLFDASFAIIKIWMIAYLVICLPLGIITTIHIMKNIWNREES